MLIDYFKLKLLGKNEVEEFLNSWFSSPPLTFN